MKQPLAIFRPGPSSGLGDLLILPAVALLITGAAGWHKASYLLPSLLPAEPVGLVTFLFLGLGTVICTVWMRRRLQMVRLVEDGLQLCYLGHRRLVTWPSIRRLERGPGRFVLHGDSETIRLPADLRHADQLAAAIASRIEPAAPVAVFQPAETDLALNTGLLVAALLPLLVLAPWFDARLPYPQVQAVAPAVAAWLVAAALLGQSGWLLREILSRRVRRFTIDHHGVCLEYWAGPPQDLPWAAVRGADVTSRGLLLRAHGADCVVPLSRGRALLAQAAIQERLGAGEPPAQVYPRTAASEALDVAGPWLGLLVCALAARTVAVTIGAFDLGGLVTTVLLAMLAALPVLLAQAMGLRARRVLVTADGLRIEYPSGVSLVPWSRLRAIEQRPMGFLLRTETGPVRFGGELCAVDDLLERVRHGIERSRAAEAIAERVDSGELEKWLGIGSDDVLAVRALRSGPLVVGGVAWVSIVGWLLLLGLAGQFGARLNHGLGGLAAGATAAFSPVWAFWLLYYPVHLALKLRADALRRVYATGHGLRWHEGPTWYEVGWDQVGSVELVPRQHRQALFYWTPDQVEADREVLVECGTLKLRYHPTDQHAARLTGALEQLMAARRAGRLMPKLSAVPAAAISRVRPDEVGAERGISRV